MAMKTIFSISVDMGLINFLRQKFYILESHLEKKNRSKDNPGPTDLTCIDCVLNN